MPIHNLLPHRLCIEVSTATSSEPFRYTMQFHLQIKAPITAVHAMPVWTLPAYHPLCQHVSWGKGSPHFQNICTTQQRTRCGGHPTGLHNQYSFISVDGFFLILILIRRESLTCDVSFVRESLFGNYPEWKKAEHEESRCSPTHHFCQHLLYVLCTVHRYIS
jgi:hypothetical protein